METLYVKAIMEICQYCHRSFTMADFLMLKHHLAECTASMEVGNLSLLMESLCYVATQQPDENSIKAALGDTCSSAVQLLSGNDAPAIQTADKSHLLKAVVMLTGAVKALQSMESSALTTLLLPMVESVWGTLVTIFQVRFNDLDLVLSCCNFIQKIIKVLSKSLVNLDFFANLADSLVYCFKSNSANISCMQTFSYLCGQMGKESEEIKAVAVQKFDVVSELIL